MDDLLTPQQRAYQLGAEVRHCIYEDDAAGRKEARAEFVALQSENQDEWASLHQAYMDGLMSQEAST